MFVHEPPIELKYSPLSVSYENGDRFYEVEPGVLCPSITSVLSVNSKESIAKWRKRVGDEEANKVSLNARLRGNEVHDLCERFVKNEDQLEQEDLKRQHQFDQFEFHSCLQGSSALVKLG